VAAEAAELPAAKCRHYLARLLHTQSLLAFPSHPNLVPHGQPRTRDGADAVGYDLWRLVSANATARRSYCGACDVYAPHHKT